jgi:hypothetical protein
MSAKSRTVFLLLLLLFVGLGYLSLWFFFGMLAVAIVFVTLEVRALYAAVRGKRTAAIGYMFKTMSVIFVFYTLVRTGMDVVFAFQYARPCQSDSPVPSTKDNGDAPVGMAAYRAYLKKLRATAEGGYMRSDSILYDGVYYPFLAVGGDAESPKARVMLVAGVHGDEPVGAYSALDLLEAVLEGVAPFSAFDLRILTPMNPVGFGNHSRVNKSGCDLNRDYRDLNHPETKFIVEEIERYRPSLIVDLHEDHQTREDGYLIPNVHVSDLVGEAIIKSLSAKGYNMSRSFAGRKMKLAGWYRMGWYERTLGALAGINTLNVWANEKGIAALTLETGTHGAFQHRVGMQRDILEEILEAVFDPKNAVNP